MIHHGDCMDVMAFDLEPESVDAVVTDPPYGLSFMGKRWDHLGPGLEYWAAMLRVAKPSSYLLAFGGTRTVHRQMVAIEDAGWEIRDLLVWAYATGFPKSKASLKPAWEPIVMARRPGSVRHLNINEARLPIADDDSQARHADGGNGLVGSGGIYGTYAGGPRSAEVPHPKSPRHDARGRWPSNVILTDPIFDGDAPGIVGGGPHQANTSTSRGDIGTRGILSPAKGYGPDPVPGIWYGDGGTYSKFFLIPKADTSEREPLGEVVGELRREDADLTRRKNTHPTVKPVDLMRHLVRLVTPPGGTVLDPFLGSGTTGIACEMEGFPWIGIEKEAEYVAIAEARLHGVQKGMGLSA